MTNPLEELRASMQPMIRDELMRSWRDGVRAGLGMAHSMAEAIHNAAAISCDQGCTVEERAAFEAQIVALGGLMSALATAAEEVPE